MGFLNLDAGSVVKLPAEGRRPESVHVLDGDSIDAINAALAAGRPLLLRGEPGTGKSQLARAAAAALGRAFHSFVVDALTEPRDLLWRLDAVTRLAEAQLEGSLPGQAVDALRKKLKEERFLQPGPIWWALDWPSAEAQATEAGLDHPSTPPHWSAADGMVLLIDEIDKADAAVPNGLLEALGQDRFVCPGGRVITTPPDVPPPLVVVTTNDERPLPQAFERRCLVHRLAWPEPRADLIQRLVEWGQAHFETCSGDVLQKAAGLLADDRDVMGSRSGRRPGGAEYLDLLRAAARLAEDDAVSASLEVSSPEERMEVWIDRVAKFTLKKHSLGVDS